MNTYVHSFIGYICSPDAPVGNKQKLIDCVKSKFNLTLDRKVYYCNWFAVRFSYSKNGSFSNTVLSLSALQKYDNIPFFVVLVRGNGSNLIYLSNSTFLSKISQSSKKLAMNNIRGSFNGSDIMKVYNDLSNEPANFDKLFAIHQGLDWEDNLSRIVEATSKIIPKSQKFNPNQAQKANIFDSIKRAKSFILSKNFQILMDDLNDRCNKCADAIMVASLIENVNLRGRIIEFMITADENERNEMKKILRDEVIHLPEFTTKDDLGDYERTFDNGHTYTDIKTKIVYLDSAPKAYNIDKFLEKMAESDSSFFFYFIGIGEDGVFNTALCSVYHNDLIDASIVQHHWAGRSTRGVIQFAGKTLNQILLCEKFQNVIDENKAKNYLEYLLNR